MKCLILFMVLVFAGCSNEKSAKLENCFEQSGVRVCRIEAGEYSCFVQHSHTQYVGGVWCERKDKP